MTSIIFCANINRGIYNQFRSYQFKAFTQALKSESQIPVHFAYNIGGGGIENRSKNLSQMIDRIISDNNHDSCHLVAFSLSGLDARLVCQNNKNIRSVTTIATPNRGSTLADYYNDQKISKEYIEPICNNIIGVDTKYFEEVNKQNIKQFNLMFPNKSNIAYFSISSQIYHKFATDLFRYTTHFIESNHGFKIFLKLTKYIILDEAIPYANDGVNLEGDAIWGNHLMTCEADHGTLMGLKSERVAHTTASIVSQNIQNLETQKSFKLIYE